MTIATTNARTLSPEDELTVAYVYLVRRVSQQDIAAILNVNQGCIAEAVTKARAAFEIPD